jgi:MFS family permease
MLLLLPLHIAQLGGDESTFGLIMATASLPTALVLGLLVRFPARVSPARLLAGSIAVYTVGAAGVAMTGSLWLLAALGLVLGTAWAVVYAASTMTVSAMVDDERRPTAFGYATGSQQLGIGLGPVLGAALHAMGLPLASVFLVGAALAAIGAVAAGLLAVSTPPGLPRDDDSSEQVSLFRTLGSIAVSPAARPLALMVLLACLYSTLTFFQPTFAAARHLDAGVFYICFTAAVIVSRFGFSRLLAAADPARVTAWATTLLSASVAGFLLAGSNAWLYGLASVATGVGYGLALPLLQAQTVNLSSRALRPRMLPLAGLLFSSAIVTFPLVAGFVIGRYGYGAIFAVLLGFAAAQTVVAWRSLRARGIPRMS